MSDIPQQTSAGKRSNTPLTNRENDKINMMTDTSLQSDGIRCIGVRQASSYLLIFTQSSDNKAE